MEKTPLELYETAYKAHYIEKKIADAVKIYEALIREFPDSNECGYAVIQLQKIKSSNLSELIRKQRNSVYTVAVAALIFASISILACGAIMYYFKVQLKIEQNKTAQTISAFGKILNGDDDGALQILDQLKKLDNKSFIPFEMSSGIYQKKKQYQKALGEYEAFFSLNPKILPSQIDRQIMENCKTQFSSPVKNVKSIKIEKDDNPSLAVDINDAGSRTKGIEAVNVVDENQVQEVAKVKKNTLPSGDAVPKNVQKNRSNSEAPAKDLFVVDPDSLSYF